MAKRQVTQIYNTELRHEMDKIMAWVKSFLTIIMYVVGFIGLNLSDMMTGGATIAKGLVSAAGPGYGWFLALALSAAFGFIQLVMWGKIFDLRNSKKHDSVNGWALFGILVLAMVMAVGDTFIDTAAIPIWISASDLQASLAGVTVWGYDVYSIIYNSLIVVTAILTMFGELFVILYFDMADSSLTSVEYKPAKEGIKWEKKKDTWVGGTLPRSAIDTSAVPSKKKNSGGGNLVRDKQNPRTLRNLAVQQQKQRVPAEGEPLPVHSNLADFDYE